MGVEPTTERKRPVSGFEDRGHHRMPRTLVVFVIKASMLTSEIPVAADLLQGAPERLSRRRILRRVLVVAVVLLIVGLLVFAGLSGIAADPMTGT